MIDQSVRVGIYARISEDRDGQQTATDRQVSDCREFATRRGWIVADEFEDIDISAYQKRAKPEFERLLSALANGSIGGVLVWKLDRLTRQQRDLVRVMEACERHGGFVASVMEPIDTRENYGQFVAELLVAQARMESANTSARQKRKHAELAKQGVAIIGGNRSFGYTRDMTAMIPTEAALIREAIELLFAGEALRGVCRQWKVRGVVSSRGMFWLPSSLRRLLISPTIVGRRELNGVVSDGQWPAIIDEATSSRLRTLLTDPARRTSSDQARRYLLSGFLRCGHCGGRMLARPRADKARRYACVLQVGRESCGKMAIMAEPTEDLVRDLVVVALDEEGLSAALAPKRDDDAGLGAAIAADEDAVTTLNDDFYVHRILSRSEYLTAHATLTGRLEAKRIAAAKSVGGGLIARYVGAGDQLRAAWAAGSLEWKRAVVGAVIDHLVVGPGVKGRHSFDPSRVTPVWRY
jgi:site-specific DNA recombinase